MGRLLGINEFAPLCLCKPLRGLCGYGFFAGQHPVIIPILLLNDGESLIEHFFGIHTRAGCPIDHLLLRGFEFEDHRCSIVPRWHLLDGSYRVPILAQCAGLALNYPEKLPLGWPLIVQLTQCAVEIEFLLGEDGQFGKVGAAFGLGDKLA